jgi:uncharacterized protein YecE (DUF72 family)
MAARIRIGISGWRYAGWRGVFYPDGLPQRRELEFAAQHFSTIELNGSFYSLQRPEYYAEWRDATPLGFVFAVKGSRYITHMRRLKDVATPLANFLASGVLDLGAKLGPMLWQFAPQMPFDEPRFDAFLALLPRDTVAAAALARRHDARLDGRSSFGDGVRRPLRHALEIRHDSFRDERFIALLRRHRVALVVADTAGRWPLIEDLTGDFVYLRLHGDKELYASGYGDAALDGWAERVRAWAAGTQPDDARRVSARTPRRRAGRDVYVYFDNDVKVHAPYDAAGLAARLGLPCSLPPRASTQARRRRPAEAVRGAWAAPR